MVQEDLIELERKNEFGKEANPQISGGRQACRPQPVSINRACQQQVT